MNYTYPCKIKCGDLTVNVIEVLAAKQRDLHERALSLADKAAAAPEELLIPACMVCQLPS